MLVQFLKTQRERKNFGKLCRKLVEKYGLRRYYSGKQIKTAAKLAGLKTLSETAFAVLGRNDRKRQRDQRDQREAFSDTFLDQAKSFNAKNVIAVFVPATLNRDLYDLEPGPFDESSLAMGDGSGGGSE